MTEGSINFCLGFFYKYDLEKIFSDENKRNNDKKGRC